MVCVTRAGNIEVQLTDLIKMKSDVWSFGNLTREESISLSNPDTSCYKGEYHDI